MIIIGLGSNLTDRAGMLRQAVRLLAESGQVRVVKKSGFYATDPVGKTDQPEFLNAVIVVETSLSPVALLELCLEVEQRLGRVRQERWGPRNIDIDLLLYEDRQWQDETLELPHPRLAERRFVLMPLLEIAPDIPLVQGRTAAELLTALSDEFAVRRVGEWNDG